VTIQVHQTQYYTNMDFS